MTTNQQPSESLIARIRALLAKAQSTDFPAERDAFNAKAAELMAQHQIDEAQVSTTEPVQRSICRREFPIMGLYGAGRTASLCWIASALGCSAYQTTFTSRVTKTIERSVTVFGVEADLNLLEMLWTSVDLQILSGVMHVAGPSQRIKLMRHSWTLGFGEGLAQKLSEQRLRAIDDTPGTGLVLITDAKRADQAMRASGRVGTKRVKADNDSLRAGHAAGRAADIGGGRLGTPRLALGRGA